MAILQGARITGSVTVTQFIKAASFSGSLTASNLYVRGNVGIGTTSPIAKLDIRPTTDGNAGISIGTGGAVSGTICSPANLFINANTGNAQSGDGRIAFGFQRTGFTGGSEVMRIIENGGNVGIGTTSAPTKLTSYVGSGTISGTNDAIRLQVAAYNNAARNTIVWAQDNSNLVLGRYGLEWNSSNSQMNFVWRDMYNSGAGSTELMRLSAAGNLGIGTTSPASKLDVSGSISIRGTAVLQSAADIFPSGLNYDIYGNIRVLRSTSAQADGMYIGYGGSGGNLRFFSNSGTTEFMTIATSGNVGIGTTSPSYKFHIYSGSMYVQGGAGAGVAKNYKSFSRLIFDTDHSDSARGPNKITLYDAGGTWVGGIGVSSDVIGYYSGANHIWHKSTSQTAFTEYMRLDSNGNLGIGTSSPTINGGGLQVYGSGQKGIRISGNSSNSYSVEIGCDTTKMSYIQTVGGLDRGLQFYTGNATTVAMTLTGSSVGIGTTSPAARLQILKTGDNGSNGLTDYGIVTVSSGNATQATLGAEVIGDGYSNLNLGSNISGVRRFWHISKRLSSTDSAHSLQYFYYDGSTFNQRFTFTTDGNLGIGTSVPTVKLAVSDGTTVAQVNPYSGVAYFGTVNNYPMALSVNSSEKVRVKTDGNVGIGTTSPLHKFQITQAADGNFPTLGTGKGAIFIAGDTNLYGMYLGLNTTTGDGFIQTMRNDSATAYNLILNSAGGNVGIGTTSPGQKLDVIGIILAREATTYTYGAAIKSLNSQGSAYVGWTADNHHGIFFRSSVSADGGTTAATDITTFREYGEFQFWTGPATMGQRLTIRQDGNIGIGTSSPGAKLDVNGDVYISPNTAGKNTFIFSTNASNDARLLMKSDTTTKVDIQANGASYFNGGNVIIGNTTAYAGLTISDITANDTNDSLAFFYRGTSGNHESLIRFYDFRGQLNASFGNNLQDDGLGTQKADLVFKTAFNANPTERMRVTNTGNVGIGTTSVSANLVVGYNGTVHYEEAGGTNVLIKGRTGNSRGLLEIHDSAGTVKSYFQSVYSTGLAYIGTISTHSLVITTTGTERVRIDTNGNVGIGSSSPSYKLHVNGTSGFEDTLNISNDQRIQTYPASTGGYGMGLTLWSANTSGVSEAYGRPGFIGRNLSWNGSNFIAATTNSGNNWGVVAGTMFTNNDVRFLTRAASENGLNYSLGTNIDSITRMLINTSGNVGIGTTSPVNKLHISGSSTNLPLKLEGLTSNATGYFLTVDNTTGVVYKSTSGANGTSGTSGANGSPGTSGSSGASGAAGTSGSSGANGGTGSSGSSGTTSIKAWVHFDGTATSGTSGIAPNASNNVSSITDNGTGDYTINFTSAFANAFYVVSGTVTYDYENPGQSINNTFIAVPRRPTAQAAGSCRIVTFALDNVLYDCKYVRVSFSN